MARSFLRDALRTRARQLANVENDPNIGDAELNSSFNLHLGTFHDFLVTAGRADYHAKDATVTTVAGTTKYLLTTAASDFMSLHGVYAQEGTDLLRPIDPMKGGNDRGNYRSPQGVWTVAIEYIPCAPTINDDATSYDSVDGWDTFISASMARDVLVKRQGDVSIVNGMIAEVKAHIRTMASPRDKTGPMYLEDVERAYPWPRSVRIDAYRLRGLYLELFESVWGWA
jgi:hypothetical protein